MYDGIARKSAPYLFLGQTTSLVRDLPRPGAGQDRRGGRRHLLLQALPRARRDEDRWCRTIRSTGGARSEYLKPGDRPLAPHTRTERGCPWDCGLCPDHEQHSCLAIVEINEACNLACPVCFADSSPQARTRIAAWPRSSACSTPWWRAKASPTWCRSRAASRPSIRRSCEILDAARAPADQARDAQHQRHPHRRGSGLRRCAGRAQAGLRGLPAVRSR